MVQVWALSNWLTEGFFRVTGIDPDAKVDVRLLLAIGLFAWGAEIERRLWRR